MIRVFEPIAGEPSGRALHSALAIGVFDGVHRGHRAVLERAIAAARRNGIIPGVLTFVEHPQSFLCPSAPVPLLTPWEEKQELLLACGIEQVIGVRFSPEFARQTPREFARWLYEQGARAVSVGEDFAFGANGSGSVSDLMAFGAQEGFSVEALPTVCLKTQAIKSSYIRELLLRGDVQGAQELLGYRYSVSGEVVAGDQRGRLLGFPTANLRLPSSKLVPAHGVYAGIASERTVPGFSFPAVINVGRTPTFYVDGSVKIEAHLLGFEGDLYGRKLSVELLAPLRGEKAFTSVEHLKEQIHADIALACGILELPI